MMLECYRSATSWPPTSSLNSAATLLLRTPVDPASGRARFAWWRRICAPARRGGYGAANSGQRRHSRSGRMRCSSPSTPAPSSAVSAPWAGRCRPTFSTSSPNFATAPTACTTPAGAGLVGALTYFGLDGIGATEKDEMRALVLRGGPWSDDERAAILDYCASDVAALERLLPAMLPRHRSAARSTARPLHGRRRRHGIRRRADRHADARRFSGSIGPSIQDDLIARDRCRLRRLRRAHLQGRRWAQYLAKHNIPWPRLESGRLDLE